MNAGCRVNISSHVRDTVSRTIKYPGGTGIPVAQRLDNLTSPALRLPFPRLRQRHLAVHAHA